MYKYENMEQETKFLDMNSSPRVVLINTVSIQVLFHVLAVSLTFLFTFLNLRFISTEGLSSFAMDMWGIILLVVFPAFLYIKLKRIQNIPLYFIAAFPAVSLLFSSNRIASSWVVLILAILSCAIVLQKNYRKIKQQELDKD